MVMCYLCGKEETLQYIKAEDGRFYIDIQGKVFLRVKNLETLRILCKSCAEKLKL